MFVKVFVVRADVRIPQPGPLACKHTSMIIFRKYSLSPLQRGNITIPYLVLICLIIISISQACTHAMAVWSEQIRLPYLQIYTIYLRLSVWWVHFSTKPQNHSPTCNGGPHNPKWARYWPFIQTYCKLTIIPVLLSNDITSHHVTPGRTQVVRGNTLWHPEST